MNNDDLQAYIKAIRDAFERGEIEELLPTNTEWTLPYAENIMISADDAGPKYRIKPKPLECWVVVSTDGTDMFCDTPNEAEEKVEAWNKEYPKSGPHRVVHMREVTE